MEKIIDGKVYVFLPDSENPEHDGCLGCAFYSGLCLYIGDKCMVDGGIWKLKEDGKK